MSVLREIIALFSIEVDDKQLVKSESLVQKFTKGMLDVGKGVVAAFAVDKVIEFGREIINQAEEVKNAGEALGIVPQHLQQLEYAAAGAGIGVDELRGSLSKLNMQASAAAGGGQQAEAFKKLGVEVKKQDGTLKTSGELFEEVGIAIAGIQNPTERAGAASDIFGKSYAKLLPLFAQGGKGLAELKQEASELGIVMDDSFMAESGDFNRNMGAVTAGVRGFMIQAIGPLLPSLVEFVKIGTRVAKTLVSFAKSTRILQVALGGLATHGIALLIAKGLKMVKDGGGWIKFFEKIRMTILRTILPLLVIEDILAFFFGGKSLLGDILGPKTTKMIQDTVKAFMDAPDKIGVAWDGLLLTFEILWSETKFGFLYLTATIMDAFAGAWNFIIESAQSMVRSLASTFAKVPGMADVASSLGDAAKGLEGFKSETGRADVIDEAWTQDRLRIAGKADALAERAKPPKRYAETEGDMGTGKRVGASEAKVRIGTTTVDVPRKQVVDAKITAATAPAQATAVAPAPVRQTTTVNAPANVVQNFNVQGNVDQSTVPTLRKSMKQGAADIASMRGAQAALVQQG